MDIPSLREHHLHHLRLEYEEMSRRRADYYDVCGGARTKETGAKAMPDPLPQTTSRPQSLMLLAAVFGDA